MKPGSLVTALQFLLHILFCFILIYFWKPIPQTLLRFTERFSFVTEKKVAHVVVDVEHEADGSVDW